ncbi:MAG: HPr family phosphocarrier protein [Oscillospiraceae bacterium]|nr:HPr family phosphocarrier protein [Oscillospiraceae bacterium]
MKSFTFTIKDPQGIHARPAGLLVKLASSFANSTITLEKEGKTADAKRIFAVMGLAAKKDEVLTVTVSGGDEEAAAQELEKFLNENL